MASTVSLLLRLQQLLGAPPTKLPLLANRILVEVRSQCRAAPGILRSHSVSHMLNLLMLNSNFSKSRAQHDSAYADADLDAGWPALAARRADEFGLLLRMHSHTAHADALRVLVSKLDRCVCARQTILQ